MSTSSKQLRRSRRYSDAYRRARVKDYESGTFSIDQLSRLYHINRSTLYRWVNAYSSQPPQSSVIVEIPNSQTEKVKSLEARIALLERALGNKQLEVDLANAKLKILADRGVEVEKKACTTKPSNECVNNRPR